MKKTSSQVVVIPYNPATRLIFLSIQFLDDAVLLCPLYDFRNVSERKTSDCICATVVYSDATCLRIVNLCTWEAYVRHVAHTLVRSLRTDEVRTRTVCGLPRLLEVEQCRTEGIYITVARTEHAMIEEQPAL